MKIVIDIPEDEYQHTIQHYKSFPRDISRWEQRIVDGTPLPKGCDIQRIIPKKWMFKNGYIQNVLIRIVTVSYQQIMGMGIILLNVNPISVLIVDRLFYGKVSMRDDK